jgi:hypothetical protein
MDLLNQELLKRIGTLTHLTTRGFAEYRHTERLPDNHGVLLVKHQSFLDIVMIGTMLHAIQGRYAHHVMKSSLPGLLGYLGGICLVRAKEARKDPLAARATNDLAYRQIAGHLNTDGLIVVYPEGHRNWGTMGELKREGIERLVEMQTPDFRIPFSPVGIQYGPGAKVVVTVGKTRFYESFDAISARELKQTLAELSGLSVA